MQDQHFVAKFFVLDCGDIVDSVVRLSYRPARLQRLVGRYDNPMPESTIPPSRGPMNLTGKNLCGDVARSTENGMVWPLPGCE